MRLDKRIQYYLDEAAIRLNARVDIVNETGQLDASSQTDAAEKEIDDNVPQLITADANEEQMGGKSYFRMSIGENILYLVVHSVDDAIKPTVFFLVNLCEEILNSAPKRPGLEQVFRRTLLGRIEPLDLQEAINDYKIDTEAARCVIVIQTRDAEANSVYTAMKNLFSVKNGDVVTALNRYSVAVVKIVEDQADFESIQQLVSAIDETLQTDLSVHAEIGVGNFKTGLVSICDSFDEAQEAINLGLTQQSNKRVFVFQKLLFERFMKQIPRDIKKQFYEMSYTDTIKKLLNEEMQKTVEKFFENSLNLSEAARNLYIHRNTLIYRLEKIQKITGLDLRNFEDAVLLKVLIMLGKSLNSSNTIQ
jgi:carbohydrate diacid regulator